MQVLCFLSESPAGEDTVCCTVCGQAFRVVWSSTSQRLREERRATLPAELAEHHEAAAGEQAHPRSAFTLPHWSGVPQFSGAAMLGGLREWPVR
jgi:hypothetical protein